MLEESWRNVSLHKCPTTQILSRAENIFKAIYKPINNLIMSHQEKVHWTHDTHQGTQNKKKGCQKSICFWGQNSYKGGGDFKKLSGETDIYKNQERNPSV